VPSRARLNCDVMSWYDVYQYLPPMSRHIGCEPILHLLPCFCHAVRMFRDTSQVKDCAGENEP